MSHLSQVVQTLPSDPSLNKIGPTICGYSSGCRLWASISRSFDHRRAQSECICKCVQIRFILTYGCKWVFSLVFTATSTVWLKNLYLNMLSWYDVRFNSKLTTGHFFVDHFVNTSSEESTRVSTLEWPTRSEFPHRNADIKMPKGKLPRLWQGKHYILMYQINGFENGSLIWTLLDRSLMMGWSFFSLFGFLTALYLYFSPIHIFMYQMDSENGCLIWFCFFICFSSIIE